MSAFSDLPTEEDFKQFPFLFEPTGREEQPLQFVSLDIGKGWYTLVYTLCGAIKEYLGTVRDEDFVKNFYAIRIKQKFGGLRFYVSRSDKVIYNMVREAEEASWEMCEECGRFGVPRPLSYIETLCQKHYFRVVWEIGRNVPFGKWLWLLWDAITNKNGGRQ